MFKVLGGWSPETVVIPLFHHQQFDICGRQWLCCRVFEGLRVSSSGFLVALNLALHRRQYINYLGSSDSLIKASTRTLHTYLPNKCKFIAIYHIIEVPEVCCTLYVTVSILIYCVTYSAFWFNWMISLKGFQPKVKTVALQSKVPREFSLLGEILIWSDLILFFYSFFSLYLNKKQRLTYFSWISVTFEGGLISSSKEKGRHFAGR